MSYEPVTKKGIFFGGYHSTTQTIPDALNNAWTSNNTLFPFDTIIDNATVVNNEIKLSTDTKAYITGDLNTTHTGSQNRYPIFSYGFTNSKYQNSSMHNRNEYSQGVDNADAFIVGSTQMRMHAHYQLGSTRNIPSNDFIAGFYV